jgi:ATP-dependent Clp protease ATP-binding subunit ClpC
MDEIEKAHPDVFNMLLQIMEEGRLTDSFGRHVDFRNTILIMTSNLGSHMITSGGGLGFGKPSGEASEEDKRKKIKANVMAEVERHFRPEFLNRVDELVVFNPLTREDLKQILQLQLAEVLQRIEKRGVHVELATAAEEFLIKQGFSEDYGARPLRRAIERFVEDPLAEHLLRAGMPESISIKIGLAEDGETLRFEVPEPEPVEEEPVEAG